jgi:hypothetical protein
LLAALAANNVVFTSFDFTRRGSGGSKIFFGVWVYRNAAARRPKKFETEVIK